MNVVYKQLRPTARCLDSPELCVISHTIKADIITPLIANALSVIFGGVTMSPSYLMTTLNVLQHLRARCGPVSWTKNLLLLLFSLQNNSSESTDIARFQFHATNPNH